MTEPKRDPRIDPLVGDVVRKGTKERQAVSVEGGNIYYVTKEGGKEKLCWITTWRDWCDKAVVVTKAWDS